MQWRAASGHVNAQGPYAAVPAAASDPRIVTVMVAPPPPVIVTSVQLKLHEQHQVTQIVVTLSGPVDSSAADQTITYGLSSQGKQGLFKRKVSTIFGLRKAVYTSSNNQLVLTPRTPFSLARSVQLTILGTPPRRLQDKFGRFIDGDDNGQPGSNANLLLERRRVVLAPTPPQFRTS
jgi:hypothetical protein